MTILIVDDDRDTLEMLAAWMRCRAHTVLLAGSVAEAATQIGEADLVLTDLCMPGRDGIDLVRECQRGAPGLPVLVMTAYHDAGKAEEARLAGAREWIPKPLDFEALDRAVMQCDPRASRLQRVQALRATANAHAAQFLALLTGLGAAVRVGR